MVIYTKAKLAYYAEIIRRYNGRVASYVDWEELLEVPYEHFELILSSAMSDEEVREVKYKTEELGAAQVNQKNILDLCYSIKDVLGVQKYEGGVIGKFIDPLNSDTILTEGSFRPKPYDLLYVVDKTDDGKKKYLSKFLVEGVLLKRSNIYVQAIRIKKVRADSMAGKMKFDSTENYVLSLL